MEGILHRPVWAEINLDRLAGNMQTVRNRLKSGIRIMAVIKGDAYGHGAAVIAETLLNNGADGLAVALVDEGVELRRAGIMAPILVLGSIIQEEISAIVKYNLMPTVCQMDFARALGDYVKQLGKQIRIHIKFDTGTGGIGILPDELDELINAVCESGALEIDGMYTHLVSAYRNEDDLLDIQILRFTSMLEQVRRNGISPSVIHAASSPAFLRFPQTYYDMVRIGTVLYGIPSSEGVYDMAFQPVMQLKARISHIKTLPPAYEAVAYKDILVAKKMARVATIPFGYVDVLPLLFVREFEVLICGKRAPVFGAVRMDQFMVDITDIPEAQIGDEVVIFGEQGEETITVSEVAAKAGIAAALCESICLLGRRVPRVYISENSPTRTVHFVEL